MIFKGKKNEASKKSEEKTSEDSSTTRSKSTKEDPTQKKSPVLGFFKGIKVSKDAFSDNYQY